MEDIKYKEYTEQESKRYTESIEKLNNSMAQGLTFDDACSRIDVADPELKRLITEDFLMISIAQLHYEKGFDLKDVAKRLSISYERVSDAHKAMLQDVQVTSIAEYHKGISKGQA
jgi:DNA-directed RNA polymerase specialized sigma subunit